MWSVIVVFPDLAERMCMGMFSLESVVFALLQIHVYVYLFVCILC